MEQEIFDDLQEQLHNSTEAYKRETAKLRTGRASTNLLDGVRLEYYGQETILNQVATVSVVDARMLQVKPWERNMCGPIEKAILQANLGVTPSNRGDVVLVPIPPMTGDRRREMVKLAKHLSEEAKISARNARRDAMDLLESLDDFPEDDLLRGKKKIQDLTDAAIKKIEQILVDKEAEILEV